MYAFIFCFDFGHLLHRKAMSVQADLSGFILINLYFGGKVTVEFLGIIV